jgi:hypothetical protein
MFNSIAWVRAHQTRLCRLGRSSQALNPTLQNALSALRSGKMFIGRDAQRIKYLRDFFETGQFY